TNSENTTLTLEANSSLNYKYVDYPGYRLISIYGLLSFIYSEKTDLNSILKLISLEFPEEFYTGIINDAGMATSSFSTSITGGANYTSCPVRLFFNRPKTYFSSYLNLYPNKNISI